MAQSNRCYGSITAAKHAGISLRQLYYWVDVLRVVHPATERHGRRRFRRYSSSDIASLKRMRDLIEWGYTVHAATRLIQDDLSAVDCPTERGTP